MLGLVLPAPFLDAEWELMDVSEIENELIQISDSTKCPAVGMAAVPPIGFVKAKV